MTIVAHHPIPRKRCAECWPNAFGEEEDVVLYYDGPDARVTDAVLEVWRPYYQRFPIRELYDVYYSVGLNRTGVRCRYVSIVTLAMICATWPFLHTAMDWLAALAALVVAAAISQACVRAQPSELALRARYKGLQVELYSSTDARVFGQVRRALGRSLERLGGW